MKRLAFIPLAVCLVFSCALRLTGLTRGLESIVPNAPPAAADAKFYGFHPDEDTVIRAALSLASPFDPPTTNYGLLPLIHIFRRT